jgi:hypothetical protein
MVVSLQQKQHSDLAVLGDQSISASNDVGFDQRDLPKTSMSYSRLTN